MHIAKDVWNYKDKFAEIDEKISSKNISFNSLINQETVKDYIHQSFFN